ncbi:MAG: bifunctional lysylphosphatidylglycerol flippase/synthetase MprF, partial [Pseudoclavibacter sp.]
TNPEPASFVDVLIDLVVIAVAVVGLRIGRRWAWLLSLLLVVWNLLGAAVVTLVLVIAPEELAPVIGDAEVALASAVLWLLFGIFLISTRNAFRLWRAKPLAAGSTPVTADEVRALLHEQGGGTLSWMTTWDRMNYLRTSGGIVPFQTHGGVAIVLADPLGASDTRAESAREFIRAAEQRALTPCFFSASAATKDAMPPGWRSLVIADDTLVDLEGLEFKGKAWSKVRQSFSRADREGMSFRLTRLGAEPFAVRAQLQAISEQWVGEKGLPEMRFTLGTLEEAADPEVRLALALDAQGNVDGMLSWLPVYGPAGEGAAGGDGPDAVVDVAEVDSADAVVGDRGDGDAADTAAAAADTADVDAVTGAAPPRPIGWTLDVMRRRDGGFPAVMEYLIGQSAKAFGEEGAQTVSLSGAPLANEGGGGHDGDRGVIVDLLDRLGESLEPVYGFRSLHRFKKKFNPRYEPIYLLYRDEGDLPAIGSGLTRAFLPDASLAQFAAAGLELARGTRE